MNYKDKKILIIGLGKSGLSAAEFFIARSAKLTCYDRKYIKTAENRIGDRVNLIMDTEPENIDPLKYDLIVTSPGVSPDNYILGQASKKNIPVISEMEVACRELPDVKVVAVTGTNGKTTTCRMIENLISGRVIVAGNIGTPLTSQIGNIKPGDIIVLEVSSYQIPYTPGLIPSVGIILNLFPEHLKWHGNFKNYMESKKKMFLRQDSKGIAVINDNLKDLKLFTENLKSQKYYFSVNEHSKPGCYLQDGVIMWRRASGEKENLADLTGFSLRGDHNIENYMAALTATKLLQEIEKTEIKLRNFNLPAHRLEEFKKRRGVVFVNDSKATNTDATLRALESYGEPVVLLMGGELKNSFHNQIISEINKKVREIILFGDGRHRLSNYLNDIDRDIHINKKKTLRQAVQFMASEIKPGDTVLFSPGGASFDEFKNYRERGGKFKKWVEEIIR
ncbi:MAG: UDP-N-acetylmuramoyl-L-alanine--D-glutamate ligase [Elusimicrobiota bacterium]